MYHRYLHTDSATVPQNGSETNREPSPRCITIQSLPLASRASIVPYAVAFPMSMRTAVPLLPSGFSRHTPLSDAPADPRRVRRSTMSSPAYARRMARYNQWQNNSLMDAATGSRRRSGVGTAAPMTPT